MKKLLTLPNILKLAAAFLGIVAFTLMFSDQLFWGSGKGRVFLTFDDAMFGDGGAAITFIGYLLVLIASLGLIALVLLKLDKKHGKLVALCLGGILILSAIFIFIEANVYNGIGTWELAAGPILAGVFALLAGLAACASEFLKK